MTVSTHNVLMPSSVIFYQIACGSLYFKWKMLYKHALHCFFLFFLLLLFFFCLVCFFLTFTLLLVHHPLIDVTLYSGIQKSNKNWSMSLYLKHSDTNLQNKFHIKDVLRRGPYLYMIEFFFCCKLLLTPSFWNI